MTKNKDVSYEQLVAASHVLIAANFKESGNYPSEAMIRETVAKVRIAWSGLGQQDG